MINNYKKIRKITQRKLFYGVISLIFIYLNHSYWSWNFFDRLGGLALAKVAPEIIGILFFLVLAKFYVSKFYRNFKVRVTKRDWLTIFILILTTFIFRFKQFYIYFYKDDFYFWLNREGIGYSVYKWGPWLSSHPGWIWELVRFSFGYSIFPYQIVTILSHIFLGVSVYFLSKFLSKSYYVGLISSFLVLTTTISFEAFQWVSHPISFAWQGSFICLSVIACIWEITETKNKEVPYLSAFLMMPVFASGIARIGFALPLLSGVCFLASARFFNIRRWNGWVLNFLSSQWIFYFMVLIFFTIRGLWGTTARTETIDAPFYKIYLYLIGNFTFPVELLRGVSKLSFLIYPVGVLTVWAGLIFLIFLFIVFMITKIRGKFFPIILSVGLIWLLVSALYYALFAPHVPVSNSEIDVINKSHHLSYLASIGPLMIWGYFAYKILHFFWRIKRLWGKMVFFSLVIGVLIVNYKLLSKQYDNFFDFPKGINITRQQFFFDTYRKYIPVEASILNIFYDDGSLIRRDNYKPANDYFRAFWERGKVKILSGYKDLSDYLVSIHDEDARNMAIDNLYYIYTDYQGGLVQENLSADLRKVVKNPEIENLPSPRWDAYWGSYKNSIFLPEIVYDRNLQLNYSINPVLIARNLKFPAILTPRLKIKVEVVKQDNSHDFIDLRAGVLSQVLYDWTLPTRDQMLSLAKYYNDKRSQVTINLDTMLSDSNVKNKFVCGDKTNDFGIAFLIFWFGEPDSYFNSTQRNPEQPLIGYLDRYYSICYFPDPYGIKEMDFDLPYLGSILRQIVIIPLVKQSISIKIINSNLSTPQVLK